MNCIKHITALACAVAVSFAAKAQHEFSLGIGGGLTMMSYKPTGGNFGLNWGGTFGLDYAYFFTDNWGIGLGMGITLYGGKYVNSEIKDLLAGQQDIDGERFDLHYAFADYAEVCRSFMLTIPLMLHYQSGMFYMALGAKAGVPFYSSYSSSGALNTEAHSSQWGILDAPLFRGFGRFENVKSSGQINFAAAFFAAAEFGIKWSVGSRFLYTGIYLDYGINNVYQTFGVPKKQLLDYNKNNNYTENPYQPNSVFHSQAEGKALIEKVIPMAAGIKIALTLIAAEGGGSYSSSSSSSSERTQSSSAGRSSVAAREAKPADAAANPYVIRPHGNAEICLYITGDEGKKFDIAEGQSITFADATYEYIDDKIEHLRLHPNTNVIIGGQNCCMCMGPITPQLELARIHTARRYLIMKGIAPRRISVKVNNTAVSTAPEIPNPMENLVPAAPVSTTPVSTPSQPQPQPQPQSDTVFSAINIRQSGGRRQRPAIQPAVREYAAPQNTLQIAPDLPSQSNRDTAMHVPISQATGRRTFQNGNNAREKYILFGTEY